MDGPDQEDIKKMYYHLDPKFWKWVSNLCFGPHHNFPDNERLRNKARSVIGFNDITGENGPALVYQLSAFVRQAAWAEKAFYTLAAEYRRINDA